MSGRELEGGGSIIRLVAARLVVSSKFSPWPPLVTRFKSASDK
jgi:hypothetical protein